jgi:hypothetical protein
MDMTIKSPVQVFINNKFFFIANKVEIKENSAEFRKSIVPDNVKIDPSQFTGMVVNIQKVLPLKKNEKAKMAEEKSKNDYDEFFHRMVDAVGDPDAHLPI